MSQIAQDFAIKVYVLNTYEVMYELPIYLPKCTSLIRGPLYLCTNIFLLYNMKRVRLGKSNM